GPNRPLSLHVVGGQFDRVWSEGRWLVGSASAPAVDTGAQVLPLLPAQGGFAELTFTEPGHYPVVNHVMSDAERGARGMIRVTRGLAVAVDSAGRGRCSRPESPACGVLAC